MITTSIGYTSTINNVWNTRQIQHRYIDYYIPVELDIHTTRQVILVRLVCVPLALCSRLLVGTMLGCGLFLIPSALFLIIYSSLPGVNACLSCLLRSNRRYAWIYCAVIRDSSSVAVWYDLHTGSFTILLYNKDTRERYKDCCRRCCTWKSTYSCRYSFSSTMWGHFHICIEVSSIG